MKLLLLNPNTSAAMTQGMADSARQVAAAATVVVARQPSFGPASIESHFDDVFGAASSVRRDRHRVFRRSGAGRGARAHHGAGARNRRSGVSRRVIRCHRLFGGDNHDAHLRHRRTPGAALRL
jgi:Asp/Glu/Hydantoin racemase